MNVENRLPASIRLPQRMAFIAVALAAWLPVAVLIASLPWRSSFLATGSSRTAIIISLALGLWVTAGALTIWCRMRWRQVVARLDQGALLCARCGYDVAYGASAACPECGIHYEASGLRAYWLGVLARRDQTVAAARRYVSQVAFMGTLMALMMLQFAIQSGASLGKFSIRLAMLLIVYFPAAYLWYRLKPGGGRDTAAGLTTP